MSCQLEEEEEAAT